MVIIIDWFFNVLYYSHEIDVIIVNNRYLWRIIERFDDYDKVLNLIALLKRILEG